MPVVRESVVEKHLVNYANDNGIFTRKCTGQKSVLDREFLFRGHWLKMEIKRPGKRPTLSQIEEMAEIQKNGGWAEWCDSFESGRRHLDELLEKGRIERRSR